MSLGIMSLCEHFEQVNKLEKKFTAREVLQKSFFFQLQNNNKNNNNGYFLKKKKSTYEVPASVLKGFRVYIIKSSP